jgi:hypothetical protein
MNTKQYPTIEYNNGHKSTYLTDSSTTVSQTIDDARQLMPAGATCFRIVIGKARTFWMR